MQTDCLHAKKPAQSNGFSVLDVDKYKLKLCSSIIFIYCRLVEISRIQNWKMSAETELTAIHGAISSKTRLYYFVSIYGFVVSVTAVTNTTWQVSRSLSSLSSEVHASLLFLKSVSVSLICCLREMQKGIVEFCYKNSRDRYFKIYDHRIYRSPFLQQQPNHDIMQNLYCRIILQRTSSIIL